MSAIPEVLTTEKLEAAGMRPIQKIEFMQLIEAIAGVEGENVENLDLDRADHGSFICEMKDVLLAKLSEIERCYRLGDRSGYPWYYENMGAYLSAVNNPAFTETFPDTLVENYEISANYANFIREVLRLFIKSKSKELALAYEQPFIDEDTKEIELDDEEDDQ